MTVSKTVSMPLDLLNRVMEEADIMGKPFSEAVQILIRIGVNVREQDRRGEAEKILNAKNV